MNDEAQQQGEQAMMGHEYQRQAQVAGGQRAQGHPIPQRHAPPKLSDVISATEEHLPVLANINSRLESLLVAIRGMQPSATPESSGPVDKVRPAHHLERLADINIDTAGSLNVIQSNIHELEQLLLRD